MSSELLQYSTSVMSRAPVPNEQRRKYEHAYRLFPNVWMYFSMCTMDWQSTGGAIYSTFTSNRTKKDG